MLFVSGGWGGGGGKVRHNFWEIWRGVRANLPLLRGGGCCVIFLLAKLIFRPAPPLLIIFAQSLIEVLSIFFSFLSIYNYKGGFPFYKPERIE